MTRPIVALSRRLPAQAEAALAERFDLRRNESDVPWGPAEFRVALQSADGVVCTVSDRLGADVLVPPVRARVLANFGVGVNHIDLEAARRAGLVVTNTPDVLTEDTADLAMALLLAVARGLGSGERLVRSGQWEGWGPTAQLGTRVSGKTLGVVGCGRIGQAVARRARFGFDMPVLYHQRQPLPSTHDLTPHLRWCESLDELLPACDFVSLHVPATPHTRQLMDARRLALMRPTAFLINTARGDVVDEAALAAAVRSGGIAGAGLDVYEREPQVAAALLDLPRVVLLPHLGSATTETRVSMGLRCLANLAAVFGGRVPPDAVC
ncbi:MAG TPA: D-glycerate dehydrogenase [Gemmatimonadaceae bacterium]|nr:D-glycerate dehydrogenase [Gemmatimonadaceae bacterium]